MSSESTPPTEADDDYGSNGDKKGNANNEEGQQQEALMSSSSSSLHEDDHEHDEEKVLRRTTPSSILPPSRRQQHRMNQKAKMQERKENRRQLEQRAPSPTAVSSRKDSLSDNSLDASEQFVVAMENKDLTTMQQLLDQDLVDPNQPLLLLEGSDNTSDMVSGYGDLVRPVYLAAKCGFTAAIKLLLETGADPNLRNLGQEGHTPLYVACLGGLATKERRDPNKSLPGTVVKLLLDGGADPNLQTRDGHTPLWSSAISGDENSMKMLLEGGAKVNLIMKDGYTALHGAASFGQLICLKHLLRHGANPNVQTTDSAGSILPLHATASKGNYACVKCLIYQGGAKWDIPDQEGSTPLCIAAQRVDPTVIKDFILRTYFSRKNLFIKSSTADQNNNTGNYSGLIREPDIDDNDSGDDGSSTRLPASTFASVSRPVGGMTLANIGTSSCNFEECVRLLVERDIAGKDETKNNALQKAVELSHEELVDILLKNHSFYEQQEDEKGDDAGQEKQNKKSKRKMKKKKKLNIKFFRDRSFVLFKPNNCQFIVFLLQREDLPWKAKHVILERCFEELDDENEIAMYLHAGIKDLNAQSIEHNTVYMLMFDFVYRTLILFFLLKFLFEMLKDPDDYATIVSHATEVFAYTIITFGFRVIIELFTVGMVYFKIFWSWVNVLMIVLVLMTATGAVKGKNINSASDGYEEGFRMLAMSAVFFTFFSLVGSLRVTFIAFSQFVGGLSKIMVDILPFLTITFIILVAFTSMYYIQRFGEDGFETFASSFNSLFTAFIGGPEGTDGILDVLFGVLSIVILLNVVIAIISSSWDNAVQSSFVQFCYYRLQLLRQVQATKRFICCFPKGKKNKREKCSYDEDYEKFIETKILSRLRPVHQGEEWWHLTLSEKQRKCWDLKMRLWEMSSPVLIFVLNLLPWLLGIPTFGGLWPRHIRECLFGMAIVDDEIPYNDQSRKEQTRNGIDVQEFLELRKEVQIQTDTIDDELAKLREEVKSIKQMNVQILELLQESKDPSTAEIQRSPYIIKHTT